MMIKCLNLEKKKEKNKKLKTKVKLNRSFLVWWSRHLVSVIKFRIDVILLRGSSYRTT